MNSVALQKRRSILLSIVTVECFVLLSGVISSSNQKNLQAQALSDISPSSYEGQAAIYLQQRGIISGFPDGTFRGTDPVNRVQAAKMLLLAADYTLTHLPNTGSFPDIEPGTWYEQFALNAVQHGLMNGYPDGTFRPAQTVLRSELLKMIANAFAIKDSTPYHFTDVPTDAWFAKYAGPAEEYNLFLHDKSQLLPSAPMSREEVSWAIYQMLVHTSYNLVIRTPFDFTHTSVAKVPATTLALHPAASSSVHSSVPLQTSQHSSVITSAANIPIRPQKNCSDSDQTSDFPNGFNQDQRGNAINLLMAGPDNVYEDICMPQSNVLYEYYCNNEGYLARERINCPVNCLDGACSTEPLEEVEEIDPRRPTGTLSSSSNESEPATEKVCTDTDTTHRFIYGENAYVKGTANGILPNETKGALTDVCKNSNTLQEFYCEPGGHIKEYEVTCPLGCIDSACVSPGAYGICDDTDANGLFPDGKNFTTAGQLFVDHPEEGNFTDEDYCESPRTLNEYICSPFGGVGRYLQDCNCVDGACRD